MSCLVVSPSETNGASVPAADSAPQNASRGPRSGLGCPVSLSVVACDGGLLYHFTTDSLDSPKQIMIPLRAFGTKNIKGDDQQHLVLRHLLCLYRGSGLTMTRASQSLRRAF